MKTINILLLSLFFVFFVSCSEQSSPTESEEDHFKANGLIIESSGKRILTYFNLKTKDTLYVPIGLTEHYEIKFLSADSTVIEPPSDDEKKLGWVISDTSMLEVYRHGGDEWEFHLKGKKVGNTFIEFQVLHQQHPDFRTNKIPVVIFDETGQCGEPIGLRAYFEEENKLICETPLKSKSGLTKGEFLLNLGEKTNHIIVKLFDEANREFQPAIGHKLIIEFTEPNIAEAILAGDDEPWAFQLKGNRRDITQIIFKIAAPDGKIYYEFAPIFVKVN